MKESKIYFYTGIIALLIGACLIHWGLGLMFWGALSLLYYYFEITYNCNDKKEE